MDKIEYVFTPEDFEGIYNMVNLLWPINFKTQAANMANAKLDKLNQPEKPALPRHLTVVESE